MRIAIGGICHESSSFSPVETTLAEFESGFGLFRGSEIIGRFSGANVPTGGFIEGAKAQGFDLAPLLWTYAYPSGVPARSVYEALKRELLDRLEAELPVDGVLLDQHGAMVVEGVDDADGDLIEGVRAVVGVDCPIVVTFDLHSNHSARRVAAADAVIGFETFPHIDEAERCREAADLIVRMIRGEVRPETAFVQLPLYWHPTRQITGTWPWTEALEQLHDVEQRPGVLTATIGVGYPFSDVEDRGASVIVVTDGDRAAAESHAHQLADWLWERRHDWIAPPLGILEGLSKGEATGRYPIVLADQADSTGGGAPGDGTEVLRTFLERGIRDALILYMVDPEAVTVAHAAGVGALIDVAVGGKSDPSQGPPVSMQAEVVALSNGDFVYDGPMLRGLSGNMGPSAAIRQDGVTVVCVSLREQPIDTAFTRTLGIDCSAMRVICVKAAGHFRSGFEPIAGSIYNIDTTGVHTFDLTRMPFRKKPGAMFGVDYIANENPKRPRSIHA